MAIRCKICDNELEALAGKRCRKCRQLVCHNCLENADSGGKDGYICVECARNPDPANEEKEQESAAPAPAKEGAGPSSSSGGRMIPTWLWVVFGLALGGIFILIVVFHQMKYDRLESKLASGSTAESREAALQLSGIGSERAFKILVKSMREGKTEKERLAAIEGLGYFPDRKAVDYLTEIYENPSESQTIIFAAREAIHRQGLRAPGKPEE